LKWAGKFDSDGANARALKGLGREDSTSGVNTISTKRVAEWNRTGSGTGRENSKEGNYHGVRQNEKVGGKVR
jgi:hypothetical protein